MTQRIFNFAAGPTMLPRPVMEQVQAEFLDFQGLGVSIAELGHRSKEFENLVDESIRIFRRLTNLPEHYKVIFLHGGGRMQFSAVPLNLIARSSRKKALYVESGFFSKQAIEEAKRYGKIQTIASSAGTAYDRIPPIDPTRLDPAASYIHITSNNTIMGTQWKAFPKTGNLPLVVDATSDILCRVVDFSQLGVTYASLQKNLGPPGVAIVIVREDLLGHALPETPMLLNYKEVAESNSLLNTANTIGIYIAHLVLKWMEKQGGISVIEALNRKKAARLYQVVDSSDFYKPPAHADHRSLMNVTFHLRSEKLLQIFLKEAALHGLFALKGHRIVGGVRASIYNAMPMEGIEALVAFMEEFAREKG